MNNNINNFTLDIEHYNNDELLKLIGVDYIDNTQYKKKIITL